MTIDVLAVSKSFGAAVALQEVTLEVPAGSLTALLGPSGGGKSTLLRVVAGLEVPDSGQVLIGGRDVTRLAPKDRGIGFCFQHYAPFRHMTVWDNVAFGLTVRRRPKAAVGARVRELLELVRLEDFARRYPAQLSGGQRQRMALARALAVEPEVLLLDEPFGALDAQVRRDLRSWLRRLHEQVAVTTVLVTHDQEEAMEVADRIAVVNVGRLEQVGTPGELYDHPVNDFVLGFVGPATRLGGRPVRPHDVTVRRVEAAGGGAGEGYYPAVVQRVVNLGFEIRVEFEAAGGGSVYAQLDRETAADLDLREGDSVLLSADEHQALTY